MQNKTMDRMELFVIQLEREAKVKPPEKVTFEGRFSLLFSDSTNLYFNELPSHYVLGTSQSLLCFETALLCQFFWTAL